MKKTVSLRVILGAVGALILLGGTFWAGMAYQSHRIESAFKEAFSGLDESFDEEPSIDSAGDSEGGSAPDPVELATGEPLAVTTWDGGEMTVTLQESTVHPEAAADDVLTRNLEFTVRIENTGDVPADASLSGHYETDAGQVLDFAGVFCDENDLPEDTLSPGQFIEGCKSHDIPDDAGNLVFDENETPFFIPVPAA